jgi:hypothetical protein
MLNQEPAITSPLCDTLPDRENAAVSEDERFDIESVRLWCRSAHVSDRMAPVPHNDSMLDSLISHGAAIIAIRPPQGVTEDLPKSSRRPRTRRRPLLRRGDGSGKSGLLR